MYIYPYVSKEKYSYLRFFTTIYSAFSVHDRTQYIYKKKTLSLETRYVMSASRQHSHSQHRHTTAKYIGSPTWLRYSIFRRDYMSCSIGLNINFTPHIRSLEVLFDSELLFKDHIALTKCKTATAYRALYGFHAENFFLPAKYKKASPPPLSNHKQTTTASTLIQCIKNRNEAPEKMPNIPRIEGDLKYQNIL